MNYRARKAKKKIIKRKSIRKIEQTKDKDNNKDNDPTNINMAKFLRMEGINCTQDNSDARNNIREVQHNIRAPQNSIRGYPTGIKD